MDCKKLQILGNILQNYNSHLQVFWLTHLLKLLARYPKVNAVGLGLWNSWLDICFHLLQTNSCTNFITIPSEHIVQEMRRDYMMLTLNYPYNIMCAKCYPG